jgi:biotin-dependent carboxylase-like uncharacterized protein
MTAPNSLEILSPGLQTTIQDCGRFGFGRFGVAPSGALDTFALRIANLLVSNAEHEACLETLLVGLRIKALRDVAFAVTGADLQAQIDRRPIKMWASHRLKNGQVLSFLGPAAGCRSYIAFRGGLRVPEVMGSKSTNLPSAFGGKQGRALRAGDTLSVNSPADGPEVSGRIFNSEWIPHYPGHWKLRAMWGPQDKDFSKATRDEFIDAIYNVSPESDRTGIRLNGPEIKCRQGISESIISEGVISGAIQVPGDGKPIIILGETVTGGFRKIATVVSADLPLLGQIKPGETVQFLPVSLDEAIRALEDLENKVAGFKKSFVL